MSPARAGRLVIAVDGPAASGKGTLARRLAAHYGLPYLDTGLLYRMVARALLDAGHDIHDAAAAEAIVGSFDETAFPEERLRGREIGEAASVVAAMPAVRWLPWDVACPLEDGVFIESPVAPWRWTAGSAERGL